MNMNISLPDSDADFVRQNVESGRFGSPTDVVRAALQLLRQTENQDGEKLAWLRDAWMTGPSS